MLQGEKKTLKIWKTKARKVLKVSRKLFNKESRWTGSLWGSEAIENTQTIVAIEKKHFF